MKTTSAKRLTGWAMAGVLALTAVPAVHAQAAVSTAEVCESYAPIVQAYYEAYKQVADNGYRYDGELDGALNFEYLLSFNDENQTPAYRVKDWNGDGVPELFIGTVFDGGYLMIFDVYTYRNGEAVQLMDGIGYRAGTCVLCKNGYIMDQWSSSAAESGVKFHKIDKNGNLKTVFSLTYTADWDTGAVVCTKTRNGKTAKISEARFNALWAKYGKQVSVKFYENTTRAAKVLEKGKTAYSGQKSWSLKG